MRILLVEDEEKVSLFDANLRGELRGDLLSIQKRLLITTVSVTHDEAEARMLADRIVKIKQGAIESNTVIALEKS